MLFLGVGRRMFKASANDVAVTLKTFVVVWITEDLVALPYTLFLPLVWLPHVPEWYWMASEIVRSMSMCEKVEVGPTRVYLELTHDDREVIGGGGEFATRRFARQNGRGGETRSIDRRISI